MTWNWQHTDWPHFRWNQDKLLAVETAFIERAGVVTGASKHIGEADRITDQNNAE